jgi:orotidine-5'-phosphate decarboxylase
MNTDLIIAVDVSSPEEIIPIINSLPNEVTFYKVGLELFISAGPAAFIPLKKADKKIFLDLKLHDIPRTVARAVKTAAQHKVDILTVHAGGGSDMLKAAAEAARECGKNAPKLVAVTTLTSLNNDDLIEMGITRELSEHTLALGKMAIDAGIDGLVCSPHEAAAFRKLIGDEPILITPGIRPAGGDAGDQKRIATPSMAVKAGSSFLVVGRPILEAENPHEAATAIIKEIHDASDMER